MYIYIGAGESFIQGTNLSKLAPACLACLSVTVDYPYIMEIQGEEPP